MTYKLIENGVIHPDGFFVPDDAVNRHWQEYLEWLKDGNKPLPADPPPPPDASEVARTGARQWYEANPNGAALFQLPLNDLIAELDSIDLSALPPASRTRLRLLLKTLSVVVRVLARREGLV